MNVDTELDTWRRHWQSEPGQSEPAIPPDLLTRVERQSRMMRWMLTGDILVTACIGGATASWAFADSQPDIIVLAVATWFFIVSAWIFGLLNRRGNWSPSNVDTASFIDLSIRRARASLAAARFGALLFVVEIAFCLAWLYRHEATGQSPSSWLLFGSVAADVAWAASGLFAVFLFRFQQKKRSELARLLALREETSH
jgi:hypothetical protein